MPRKTDPALTPQYIDLGVSGGIEKKGDPKLVRAPATLDAQNLRYTTEGAIQKRLGLSDTQIPMPVGNSLACIGQTTEELLVTDNRNLYAYNPSIRQWALRGPATNYKLDVDSLFEITKPDGYSDPPANFSHATIGDVGMVAYEDSTQIRLLCYDATNGRVYWKGGITQSAAPTWGGDNILCYSPNGLDPIYNERSDINYLNNPLPGPSATPRYMRRFNDVRPKVVAFNGVFYIGLQHRYVFINNQDTDGPAQFYGGNQLTICNVMRLAESPQALTQRPLNISPATRLLEFDRYSWVPSRWPLGTGSSYDLPAANGTPYARTLNHYYDLRANDFELYWTTCGCYNRYDGNYYPDDWMQQPDTCKTYTWYATLTNPDFQKQPQATTLPPVANVVNGTGGNLTQTIPYAVPFTLVKSDTSQYNTTTIKNSGSMWLIAYSTGFSTLYSAASDNKVQALVDAYPYRGYSTLYTTPPSIVSATLQRASATTHTAYATDGRGVSKIGVANYGMVQANVISRVTPETGTSVYAAVYSNAFITDDGRPAVWLALNGVQAPSLGVLVCVGLDGSGDIARALYLRLGTEPRVGYFDSKQNWPLPVTDFSILAPEFISQETQTVAYRVLKLTRSKVTNIVTLPRGGAILIGSEPRYYDGNTVRVLGYSKVPEIHQASLTGLLECIKVEPGFTGKGLAPWRPTYIFVWEDFDTNGAVMWSSPSPGYKTGPEIANPFNLDSNPKLPSKMIVRIRKDMPVLNPPVGRCAVFRNSLTNSFQTYNRVTFYDGNDGYLYDINGDDVTSSVLLYAPPNATNGELPNDPPPPCNYAFTTPTRSWVISAERPTQAYYSKPYFAGRVPEFNEAQILDIDPASGPITGGASLDQAVIFFKRERVLLVGGVGPDATGEGAFNPTVPVPTDAGCIDSGSIITNEQGVYFRSYRGIHLLNRGYQVQYVGSAIEPLLTGRVVLSACLVANQSQIRFGLDNGVALIFDYSVKRWSIYNYPWAGATPLTGQTSFKGQWYGLLNNLVLSENDGATGDLNNSVPMVLETAWLPIAGPTGWGRVRRATLLGDWKSTHTATLSWLYDYDDTEQYDIPYVATFDSQRTPYEWRVRAPRQVCQAVKLRLTATGPGLSMNLTGISLETSVKSGAAHTSARTSV